MSNDMNRRDFLKISAFLGGSAAAAGTVNLAWDMMSSHAEAATEPGYPLANPTNIIYSVCQQCNTNCGIKVKLVNGIISKIDGNPFNPYTLNPHLGYTTSMQEAATIDGAVCPKAHAAIQTAYDPYRLVKVLKRAGKRGENKWQAIEFDKAITEIVEGGKLFANVPGEENRVVTGLKEIYALKDPKVAKAMADALPAILAEKGKDKKKALVEEFKKKFAADLDKLIDPDHPDLGPKNNQLNFSWGRLKGGRSEHEWFLQRACVEHGQSLARQLRLEGRVCARLDARCGRQ
jgi:anaerobic selenocysteine-containing dehydrogenase